MKLKDPENEKYVKAGITAGLVVAVCMLIAFAVFRADLLSSHAGVLLAILKPFIYGAVMAYLLSPLCGWFESKLEKVCGADKKKLTEPVAILLSIATGLLIIFALFILVVPQVSKSVVELAKTLPDSMEKGNKFLNELLENQPMLKTYWQDFYDKLTIKLESLIKTDLLPKATSMLNEVAVQISGIMTVLKNVFLGLIIAIYILGARKQFAAQAKLVLHGIFNDKWAAIIEEEVRYTDKMFNGFFVGKLIDSAIVGLICFVGCIVMRFESAALIAVVVGVTNIIPFFGPYLGAIPCALLLLLENPVHCLMFLVFIIVLQQIDGNVLGPIILGDSTGLSGFWIMFAILLFGGLWGLTGMLIGVPLFAVIYDIIRKLTYLGVRSHGHGVMITEYNSVFNAEKKKKKDRSKKTDKDEHN